MELVTFEGKRGSAPFGVGMLLMRSDYSLQIRLSAIACPWPGAIFPTRDMPHAHALMASGQSSDSWVANMLNTLKPSFQILISQQTRQTRKTRARPGPHSTFPQTTP